MKYIILTEGSSEKGLIEYLLDQNSLKIKYEDLLDEKVFLKLKLNPTIQTLIKMLPRDEKVIIYRIGDKLKENFYIPNDIKDKIETIEKYLTKPEYESLIVIGENKWEDYMKKRSRYKKVKIYAKENITFRRRKYTNTLFWQKIYYNHHNIIDILRTYKSKQIHNHKEDELFLIDLVKQ